jgi:hypothetical protein
MPTRVREIWIVERAPTHRALPIRAGALTRAVDLGILIGVAPVVLVGIECGLIAASAVVRVQDNVPNPLSDLLLSRSGIHPEVIEGTVVVIVPVKRGLPAGAK